MGLSLYPSAALRAQYCLLVSGPVLAAAMRLRRKQQVLDAGQDVQQSLWCHVCEQLVLWGAVDPAPYVSCCACLGMYMSAGSTERQLAFCALA